MTSGERIKTFCRSLNNNLATVYIALGVNETYVMYISECARGCEHLHLQELEPTWREGWSQSQWVSRDGLMNILQDKAWILGNGREASLTCSGGVKDRSWRARGLGRPGE